MMRASLPLLGLGLLALGLTACPPAGGPSGSGPAWPHAEKLTKHPLPGGVSWQGVYFINTSGSRGTMHLFDNGDGSAHGCWIAEDKHAKATFGGSIKDDVVELDWAEKRVGSATPPVKLTGYFQMSEDPKTEGHYLINGEFGDNESNDGGNKWEGVRLKNREPQEDGCKVDEGETVPVETPGLE